MAHFSSKAPRGVSWSCCQVCIKAQISLCPFLFLSSLPRCWSSKHSLIYVLESNSISEFASGTTDLWHAFNMLCWSIFIITPQGWFFSSHKLRPRWNTSPEVTHAWHPHVVLFNHIIHTLFSVSWKNENESCSAVSGSFWLQSMEFSRPEYWNGLPCPPPGDLPNPGIEPRFPSLQVILYQLSHKSCCLLKGLAADTQLQACTVKIG